MTQKYPARLFFSFTRHICSVLLIGTSVKRGENQTQPVRKATLSFYTPHLLYIYTSSPLCVKWWRGCSDHVCPKTEITASEARPSPRPPYAPMVLLLLLLMLQCSLSRSDSRKKGDTRAQREHGYQPRLTGFQ